MRKDFSFALKAGLLILVDKNEWGEQSLSNLLRSMPSDTCKSEQDTATSSQNGQNPRAPTTLHAGKGAEEQELAFKA